GLLEKRSTAEVEVVLPDTHGILLACARPSDAGRRCRGPSVVHKCQNAHARGFMSAVERPRCGAHCVSAGGPPPYPAGQKSHSVPSPLESAAGRWDNDMS